MSSSLLRGLSIKRKIFVSYHHGCDKAYYDSFIHTFSNTYDVIHDNSVERAINSANTDYVNRKIRENYITGSSCTIVLCGAGTPSRKFVDWEIKTTLDKQHGLIGVNLPSNPLNTNGRYTVPDRLYDNIESSYAVWVDWETFTHSSQNIQHYIEVANSQSNMLINNNRALRLRNG